MLGLWAGVRARVRLVAQSSPCHSRDSLAPGIRRGRHCRVGRLCLERAWAAAALLLILFLVLGKSGSRPVIGRAAAFVMAKAVSLGTLLFIDNAVAAMEGPAEPPASPAARCAPGKG